LRYEGLPIAMLARIEDAGLNASAPSQQRLLDGWLLRFSPGRAKRARCVNAVAAGRLPVAEKLTLCESAYAAAGLPLLVRLTPFSEPTGLDATLADAGLSALDDTRVMVLPEIAGVELPKVPRDITFHWVSHEHFAQTVGQMRGSPLAQRQAHAQRLQHAPVTFTAQVLKRDGEVLACAQMALEDEMVGLYDVYTAPTHRDQGFARALCAQLLVQARAGGARVAYLQVDADNASARSLYRRLGFDDAYSYHYRARNPVAS
jgi:ribosomal protein S18 acetylase RimI-like enzyme